MSRLKEIRIISALLAAFGLGELGCDSGYDVKVPVLQIGARGVIDAGAKPAVSNNPQNVAVDSGKYRTSSICESLNAPAGMCGRYSRIELYSPRDKCGIDDLVYSTARKDMLQISEGSQSDGYYNAGRRAYPGRFLVEGIAKCKGESVNVLIEFMLSQDDKQRIHEEFITYKTNNLVNVVVENTPVKLAGKSMTDYSIPTRGEVVRISFRKDDAYLYEQKMQSRGKKGKRKAAAPVDTSSVKISGFFDYCIRSPSYARHEMKINTKTKGADLVPVKTVSSEQCSTRRGWVLFSGKKQESM
jgi:hypothetical protein